MKLVCIKDINGIISRDKGEVVDYIPWFYSWQSMSEDVRVSKGIFVHCYGQGEFEALRIGKDVEIEE